MGLRVRLFPAVRSAHGQSSTLDRGSLGRQRGGKKQRCLGISSSGKETDTPRPLDHIASQHGRFRQRGRSEVRRQTGRDGPGEEETVERFGRDV